MARGQGSNETTLRSVGVVLPNSTRTRIQRLQSPFSFAYTRKNSLTRPPLGVRQQERLETIKEAGKILWPYVEKTHQIYNQKATQMRKDSDQMRAKDREFRKDLQTSVDIAKEDRDDQARREAYLSKRKAWDLWLEDEYWPTLHAEEHARAAAWRQSLMHILKQVRPMGPDLTHRLPYFVVGDERLARLANRSLEYLPTDWVDLLAGEQVKLDSPRKPSVETAAGVYMSIGEDEPDMPTIQIREKYLYRPDRTSFLSHHDNTALGVMYHEMIHHVEGVYPLMGLLGLAYRQDRQYHFGEEGNFVNSHMATDYEDEPAHTEIFSAMLSGLMFEDNARVDELTEDMESIYFALGALVTV